MYLIRRGRYNRPRQAQELPLNSTAWLRWFRDAIDVSVHRFHDGRFQYLYVEDQLPKGGSGKTTLPMAIWNDVPLD